jgi:hypothetical protein
LQEKYSFLASVGNFYGAELRGIPYLVMSMDTHIKIKRCEEQDCLDYPVKSSQDQEQANNNSIGER